MRRFWQQHSTHQTHAQQAITPSSSSSSSSSTATNSTSSSNRASSSSHHSQMRFRSRSHSADFSGNNPVINPKTDSEQAHDEMQHLQQPLQQDLQQPFPVMHTPAPTPTNSPPTTPVAKPRTSPLDRVPPLSAPSKLISKAATSHAGAMLPQRHVAPAPVRSTKQPSAPTTIQRSQTPAPLLSTVPHSSLGVPPSSSSLSKYSSSSSSSSSSLSRPPPRSRGCGWSPRPRQVVLPPALARSKHSQCATHCHGPSSASASLAHSEREVYDHSRCTQHAADAGPVAVAVRTVRHGPYQKLCIDPDGAQYLLKDDYAAVEVWRPNSEEPTTMALTGNIGTVRGMVWCNDRLYMTDWMYSNVLEVNLADGKVKRFVGLCQHGSIDGPASTAQFNRPWGIHADHEAQCLYVADCANNRIRRVCLRTRYTTTVAGSGLRGHTDGVPHTASFFRPSGIAVSCDHSVYVTEFSNVRQITHAGQAQHTAGQRYDDFRSPSSAALAKSGKSFLYTCFSTADSEDELSFDQVSTVTGNGRQITSSDTRLYRPRYVVEASDGSLILADCGNFRIRMVSPDRRSIKTIAGDGEERSVDMECPREAKRRRAAGGATAGAGAAKGATSSTTASFQWIYSMALCQHSDTLFVVQDDGTLREIELKFPPCITDRITAGIEQSVIGRNVPTDLVRLIQSFCYR